MNSLLILAACFLTAAVATWLWFRADNALDRRRDRRALVGCRCGKYISIPGPYRDGDGWHEWDRCYPLREAQP